MKAYLAYFILKYKTGLQYRANAYAGIVTQIFFGIIYTSIYIAFYESDITNIPMELSKLISYLWLIQAFHALIYLWYKDKDILNLIRTGNIAYELCRPQDIYYMWGFKIMGERFANASLRFIPVLLFASILPIPYKLNLSIDFIRFIFFIISFILSSILMVVIVLLTHIICMFTIDDKGIVNIFNVIADFLSGHAIPIPFFPTVIRNIINYTPLDI